jgi:beta-mannosidase
VDKFLMDSIILLDGTDWNVRSYYGEDWTWEEAHKPGIKNPLGWVNASVPGSIHADLWKAGEIPNPYFELNSLESEWVPQRTWVYRKAFFVPESWKGKHISLHLTGVDYEASFYLNGHLLGRRRSMFTPAEFEIGQLLKYEKENLLVVVLEPAPAEPSQFGSTTKAQAHKPRMNYWWDFCPRLVHIGIWGSVYLKATGEARLEDVFAQPHWSPGDESALVRFTNEISCTFETTAELKTEIYLGTQLVARQTRQVGLQAGRQIYEQELVIEQPGLWWPNGSGEQPLYTANLRLTMADGSRSDEKEVHFGIRSVELVPNEHADPDTRPFTFVINGEKTYIKGWNWVPMDALYGQAQPEKLKHLLELAKRANVNFLRVWGGGLIEKELFYDLCDRYGIMVWQEFILSCSGVEQYPSDDPAYVTYLAQEAGGIIPTRRNHPSLVMWCGGNELCTDIETPIDDSSPAIAALHAAVTRLDPDRIWLPTSPSHKPRSKVEIHGPWTYLGLSRQYDHYNNCDSQFYSEFGTEGITNLKALNAVISSEHQWPVSLANPYWRHLAVWWVKPEWQEMYGEALDLLTLQRATQLTQAEGLKYALEASRRRQYQNSGTLPWQFDEPFPMAACTSAVDYYAQPKPVYYAAAQAYEPVHISARFDRMAWDGWSCFEAQVWVSSSLRYFLAGAACKMQLIGASGKVYAQQSQPVAIPANRSIPLNWFTADLTGMNDEVFFLDLELTAPDGQQLSTNRYVFSRESQLVPLFRQPGTTIVVDVEKGSREWEMSLTNQGWHSALFVWLEDARPAGSPGYACFGENYFCLLPGEIRHVRVEWDGIGPEHRQVKVSAWNAKIQIHEAEGSAAE